MNQNNEYDHHHRDGYIKNRFNDNMNTKKRPISYYGFDNNINNIFYG